MASTTGNALKEVIEAAGFNLSASRDAADKYAQLPFVTVDDEIQLLPRGRSDGGSGEVGTERAQVNLWQLWRDNRDRSAEDPTLARSLVTTLHGARLDSAPIRVFGVSVADTRRRIERERNQPVIVHHVIDVDIQRML